LELRKTLQFVHDLLTQANIDHALIGGLAMVNFGLDRATVDVDLIIDEVNKTSVKELLQKNNFNLTHESEDVLQFVGIGYVDILLARRPISREMIKNATIIPDLQIKCLRAEDIIGLKIQAYSNDPSREFQDKADIQFLLQDESLDWNKIKSYADLFGKGEELEEIKKKVKL
jgi:hypothetical protein